jgi:hypothetical protein
MKLLTKVEVAIAEVFTLVKSAALRSKRATVAQLALKEHLVFSMTIIRLIKFMANMASVSSCLF